MSIFRNGGDKLEPQLVLPYFRRGLVGISYMSRDYVI